MSSLFEQEINNYATPRTQSPPRKRARRGASCLDCRRRKLKCDGIRPICSRCIKGGVAASCTYTDVPDVQSPTPISAVKDSTVNGVAGASQFQSDRTFEERSRPQQLHVLPSKSGHDVTVVRMLNARMDRLERQVESLNQPSEFKSTETNLYPIIRPANPVLTPHDPLNPPPRENKKVDVTTARGFHTHFFGLSHPMSVTAETELVASYSDAFLNRNPLLLRALKDLKLQDKCRKARKKFTESTGVHSSPKELLPAKDVIDPLIDIYLETIENVYHILHLPTFNAQYKQLWTQPLANADTGFVVIVLLMAAAVLCVAEPNDVSFVGEVTTINETAIACVRSCDMWISLQTQKRLTLAHFQQRILLLIAKFMNSIKVKRWYTETGTLVRLAVSDGLHLNPGRFYWNKFVPEFDIEMRCRIWATIAELDYKSSFHRGVPSTIEALFPDCPPPLDVSDDHLHALMENPPDPEDDEDFRPVSALVLRAATRKLRLHILCLANRPGQTISRAELLDLEEQVFQTLRCVPKWSVPGKRSASASFTRAHLELELKQALFLLYRVASQDESHPALKQIGRIGCLDTCASIVKQHEGLGTLHSYVITTLTGDLVQAAINVCYDLSMVAPDIEQFSVLRRPNISDMLEIAQKAISMYEIRLMRVGGVYRRYWVLLSAQAAAQAKLFPACATESSKAIADKMCNMIYRMLSFQALPVDENLLAQAQQDSHTHASQDILHSQTTGSESQQSSRNYGNTSEETFMASLELMDLPSWDWDDLFKI